MAAGNALYAKADRRRIISAGEKIDYPFLILLLLLLTVGLTMLYSASGAQSLYDTGYRTDAYYFRRQALFATIGLCAMAVTSRIPVEFWHKAAWPLYGISIFLLILVLFFGQTVNGAKRWISIAGIQFQPSEIAKFTMILLLARLTKQFGSRAKSSIWENFASSEG